jgi:hypothetical protein
MGCAYVFLDAPASPESEFAENAIKAAVTPEQQCSILKSSRNGRFVSAFDCSLVFEIRVPAGRGEFCVAHRLTDPTDR